MTGRGISPLRVALILNNISSTILNKQLDALALINHYNIDVKSDLGDRYIVYCPFHSDKNPSAVMWKEGIFHCSTCNLSLTAYQFVAMKENLNPEDKYEVGQKIKEVLNG